MILYLILVSLLFQNGGYTIDKLQEKFNSTETIIADFSQSSNNITLMKGKFYFKQKNNYRIEIKNNTIISDGETIWNVDNKRNKVIISSSEDDPLAFSLKEYIFDYPELCDIQEISENGKTVIKLIPKDNSLNFTSAKLWITKDFLINAIEVVDETTNKYLFKFSNIIVNQPIGSNQFGFKLEESQKVIDLR